MIQAGTLPPNQTFDADFTEDQKLALGASTATHGIPYFMARRLRPGFLSVILSIPPCVKIAMLRGEKGIDDALYERASSLGKETVSLETVDEQIAVLLAIDAETDPSDLLDIIAIDQKRDEDLFATMLDLYAQERVSAYLPLLRRMPGLAAQLEATDELDLLLIHERNARMVERLLPILSKGRAFVAVGALHLPGDDGLVALLRTNGYTLTRLE